MTGEATVASGPDLKQGTIAQFAGHVSPGKVAFYRNAGIEFVLGRREGPFIWDISGEKRLIDCHCNGGVFSLGHRNEDVVDTLIQGLDDYDIGNHHLISRPRAQLAAKLAELLPGSLTYTVFGVSGGEAVDLAIKVARGHTGRRRIISAKGGYHGHTGLALAAGDPPYRDPFGPAAPGFTQVPFNDLDALSEAVDDDTAAVLLETIPATLGFPMPAADYFAGVRALCDRQGALLIVDEVQAGLGRTGRTWAIEHFEVAPDILVMGKGLSGGIYPITATCMTAAIEKVFHADPFVHVSTFGGSELGCLVGQKVLDLVSAPAFLANVRAMSALFADGLAELQRRFPETLLDVRRLGLMMGLVFPHPMHGPLFTRVAYDAGLLSVYANNDTRVAQLLPPLTVNRALALEILERLAGALAAMRTLTVQHGGD